MYRISTARFKNTKNVTIIIKYATITGLSKLYIESIINLPIPGHANTVSVTVEKAIKEPNSRPITVTIGIKIFFKI